MALVLGLDIGSTSTKAALLDVTDEVSVVRVARRSTPPEAAALVAAALAVVQECALAASGPIAAIGIAAMAESGAALDANGRALTPLLRWDRHVDRVHLDRLLTQHPELPASTGVPATTKPAAVTLTALRAERPDVFEEMHHWTGVADLVGHALTGERAIDHTLAARTMLAGRRGDEWDAALLESLELRSRILPELRAPGEAAGATSAARFGLAVGIPVYIAGHDHAVGAWAAGSRRPGETADSLGTAEAIVRVTQAVDHERAVANGFAVGRTVDGLASTILGGSPACGAMLAGWDAERSDEHVLRRLGALTPETWHAASTIVLPYPGGRQCPAPDPHARAQVVHDGGDPSDRARGLLQSLIAHARWVRESADELAGSPTTALTVIGSLALRIPVWAPLAAAAGVPTGVCTAEEPVAAGAALLAAVRVGEVSADVAILPRAAAVSLAASAEDTYRRFLSAVTAEGES